ncbi:TetR/AcrR family transcriptional regulator [Companilactobacillus nuruki]|uniref:Transcriptional regulator n=1 Tax=Companilactobacillus nuruki TaxID=1993540 RepID=A0A2N7ATF2_9LACO|nr:TetR/AcrR family transcriptional regulator [Companilactobacillus nuruki]PMD69163.1 transcriptional regulator [Companilactobacillus nuruki]
MKKVDLRVQKTNTALQLAFRKLTRTTSYHSITVKKLTDMAGINRKTFYLHYDSIDDFSNTIVDEISEKLINIITGKPLKETLSKPGYIFDSVFDFFEQSRDFYTFMMTSDEYGFLSKKVESKVTEGFAKGLQEEFILSDLDAYTCASFLTRNTLMMFRLYNSGKVSIDKREFRDRLIRLNTSGLSSFIAVPRKLNK